MFNTEIEVSLKYNQYGLTLVKGADKMSVLKHFQKGYYLDLSSLATALNVNINKLVEDLSYHASIRGRFANYRNEGRMFKVIEAECLDSMIRHLASSGYELESLRTIKELIRKALEQFKKEVEKLL